MNKRSSMVANAAVSAGVLLLALTHAQGGADFRSIKLPGDNERVTGVYCASAKACVIATNVFGGAGHIYATDGQKITGTMLIGDSKLAEKLGTLGEISFDGFSKVGNRLIANVEGAGASFVSATGDITQATSWSAVKIGTVNGDGTFGLNQQMGIGAKDDRWVHFTNRMIYATTDAPGPGALWTPLWSPVSPPVPSNFEELHRADKTLCGSDPGVSITPRLTQPAYVAPDLAVILYPSGARNQRGDDTPGVCISTDGGKRFYHVEFKGIGEDYGPLGVTCLNSSKCFAYGGLDNAPESSFVYFTADAQKGVASTWTKAKLPTLREDTKFRSIAFAPDGTNGWLVGWSEANTTLLFSSTDGGASWKDATSSVRALAPNARLHSVYTFDAAHVWIGGEQNTLLTMGN
jgi:photosystem II stability/assembly factor-like uncharacterized protein